MDKMIVLLACLIVICSAAGRNETPSSEMGPSPSTPPASASPPDSLSTSDVLKSTPSGLLTSDLPEPSSDVLLTSDVPEPSSHVLLTSDVQKPSSHVLLTSDVHLSSSHALLTSEVHVPSSHTPVASSLSPASSSASTNSTATPSSTIPTMAPSPSSSPMSPSSSSLPMSPSPSNSTMVPSPSNSTMVPSPSNSTMVPSPSNSTMAPSPSNSTMAPSPSNSTMAPSPSNSTIAPSPSNSTYHPHSTPAHPTKQPTPYPDYVFFKVKNGNNTCLLLQGSIKFQIQYKVKGVKKMQSTTIQLPPHADVSGHCYPSKDNINTSSVSLKFNSLTFTWAFELKNSKSWSSTNMTLSGFITSGKSQVPVDGVLKGGENAMFLAASKEHSYECMRVETVALSDDVVVIFDKIRVQPFYVNGDKFSKAESCPTKKKSSTNDIVPIAVGCALAGLIVIVLIAYLIGRRKSSNRGYEQV